MRYPTLVLPIVLAAAPLAAQEPQEERLHEVRPGDTLWDLARHYLGDPYLWPEIHRANRAQVEDPDRIFPAERLRIPGVRGAVARAEPAAGEPALPASVTDVAPGALGRTVFSAERAPAQRAASVRRVEREEVPLVLPGDFQRAGALVPEWEAGRLGEVAELLNPSLVPMQIPAQISLYDRVFVSLTGPAAVRVGDRVQLVRRDREVEPYGWVFVSTGMATIVALEGSVATAEVDALFDAVAVGDAVVPLAPAPAAVGVEPTRVAGVEGRLVAFERPHVLQGPQDRAFVDLGREAGLAPGDELLVYLPGEVERWGRRPEVEVARLQVVRVADRTAAVRVLHLEQPALEAGLPVRQVAKVP